MLEKLSKADLVKIVKKKFGNDSLKYVVDDKDFLMEFLRREMDEMKIVDFSASMLKKMCGRPRRSSSPRRTSSSRRSSSSRR